VAYALSKEKDGRLAGFYAERTTVSRGDVAQVSIAIDQAGARTWAAEQAARHVQTATRRAVLPRRSGSAGSWSAPLVAGASPGAAVRHR
jgi:hypothetical protein